MFISHCHKLMRWFGLNAVILTDSLHPPTVGFFYTAIINIFHKPQMPNMCQA
jgi:hypothetical protein